MSEELITQQQPAEQEPKSPVVTFEIVKVTFNKELTKHHYQEALKRFEGMVVTRENTAQVQETLKNVRKFVNTLGQIKDDGKRQALQETRWWDRVYNDTLTPLQQILTSKSNELQKIQNEIAEENRKIEADKARITGIKKDIDDFLLQTSMTIASATTPDEITTIEKLIGSHKANKKRYEEFLPDLIEKCNELVPLIKNQKDHIKRLIEIQAQKNAALATGDDRKAMELEEQEGLVKHSIEEAKINVQEEAVHQAQRVDDTPTVHGTTTKVKWRRTSWKWEVQDIKLLAKKMPHLVKLVPDDEAIDMWLKTKKTDGSLEDKEEEIINGLRFYLEKLA